MNLFLAFVILLNAAALIATGYLLYRADTYLERYIADAIRKQDDRIRKRVSTNGKSEAESSDSEAASPVEGETRRAASRPATGRPWRPQRP